MNLGSTHKQLLSDLYWLLDASDHFSTPYRNCRYVSYEKDNGEKVEMTNNREEESRLKELHQDSFKICGEIDVHRFIDDILEIYEVKGSSRGNSKGKRQLKRAEKYLGQLYPEYKTKLYLVYYNEKGEEIIRLVE